MSSLNVQRFLNVKLLAGKRIVRQQEIPSSRFRKASRGNGSHYNENVGLKRVLGGGGKNPCFYFLFVSFSIVLKIHGGSEMHKNQDFLRLLLYIYIIQSTTKGNTHIWRF